VAKVTGLTTSRLSIPGTYRLSVVPTAFTATNAGVYTTSSPIWNWLFSLHSTGPLMSSTSGSSFHYVSKTPSGLPKSTASPTANSKEPRRC
jgi:hypothetical protein